MNNLPEPYYQDENSVLYCGDSALVLKELPDKSIDLTVTSPPYDNLRTYKGFVFDFETIAKELYRVTKDGGVVVWVVGDQIINGCKTGNCFRQALKFIEFGFNLWDDMAYVKDPRYPRHNAYSSCWEHMFIFSKGAPETLNPIKRNNFHRSKNKLMTNRGKNGQMVAKRINLNTESTLYNVWYYSSGYMKTTKDKEAYEHLAIFPEQLVKDHIYSWSNEGDTVLDCFCGSGTTLKAAKILKRKSIGIEISKEYCELIVRRINKPIPLFE